MRLSLGSCLWLEPNNNGNTQVLDSAPEEYASSLARHEAGIERLRTSENRVSNARLLCAVLAVAVAFVAIATRSFALSWAFIPLALFIVSVLVHGRMRRGLTQAQRGAQFYRTGLARIEDRWAGLGRSGERFMDPHHVYAADLDLFGRGSLFELLSLARTRMGEETLARWLLAPAAVEVIRERQACIKELQPHAGLREELAVLGEPGVIAVHPERLSRWAREPSRFARPALVWTARILPILTLVAITLWITTGFAIPTLVLLLIEGGILAALKKSLAPALSGTENGFEDLKVLADIFERLERERFEAPAMRALLGRLTSQATTASHAIGRLGTLANLAESRRNLIVAALEVPLMFSLHVAIAAERWRARHGASIASWFEALGELEALISLAGYAYEHPDDPFPELVDGAACFEGEELGHPLLPQASCVRNSVRLCDETRLLLVSGSNMSGKSTLLRTVGINTVLAMAGGPVWARRLRLTPLQVGANIRINDSLHEGSSRFYAEITRLRQLVELQHGTSKLLFLLDEMLQGTNSHDRRIGAEGILRAFINAGSIGLVSTHDLALTEIGGLPEGALRNVHFQDEIVDGRLRFDFTLREGVVTRSNAIALMRSIGLEV